MMQQVLLGLLQWSLTGVFTDIYVYFLTVCLLEFFFPEKLKEISINSQV